MAAQKDAPIPSWFRRISVAGRAVPRFFQESARRDEHLESIPLLINANTRAEVNQAKTFGCKCLSYIALRDLFVTEQGSTPANPHRRVKWDKRRPGMLLLDTNGRLVNTFMDGSKRMNRYLTCANTAAYCDAAMQLVKKTMDMGTDGLFIDNAGARQECYGHNIAVGYSEKYRTVIAAAPGERPSDPEIGKLSVHEHLHPGLDQNSAFARLLRAVLQRVGTYGKDKIVVVNGMTFIGCADGAMWESFVCSWAWKGKRLAHWAEAKQRARELKAQLDAGKRIIALTYLRNTATTIKDDAYFCYAAARMLDFIWTDCQTMGKNEANRLYAIDLGEPQTPLRTTSGMEYRIFEGGLLALNAGPHTIKAGLRLGPLSGRRTFEDTYAKTRIQADRRALPVDLPPESGRVYLCE